MENEQTQLERANEELLKLVPNITSGDKSEAESLYHKNTIFRYLKGEGKDADTAVALLSFFRKKIEERDEKIEAANEQPAA